VTIQQQVSEISNIRRGRPVEQLGGALNFKKYFSISCLALSNSQFVQSSVVD